MRNSSWQREEGEASLSPRAWVLSFTPVGKKREAKLEAETNGPGVNQHPEKRQEKPASNREIISALPALFPNV